jgi:uracil-DNA glycosylase
MYNGRGLQANLVLESPEKSDLTQARALLHWEPERWPVSPDWQPVISRFLGSEPAQRLGRFVQDRLEQGATVYPPQPFRALELTPLEHVKVVILGQDPYHGPGQAQGLAFSVAPGVKLPPSLRNVFKEIARDSGGGKAQIPVNGSLQAWAQQGVLLLNTCMTVEQGEPASHAKQGWEVLTDAVIQAVAACRRPVVFMLWGAHAQAKRDLLVQPAGQPIDGPAQSLSAVPRLVLTANHPSPLSALRPPQPFIGCGHFGAANSFLIANGLEPIAWC